MPPGGRKQKLSSFSLDILFQQRAVGNMCDGILRTEDGGEFQVHRIVMLACSPYFYALYAGPLNNSQRKSVLIPGVPATILWEIIHYAYTRTTNVYWDNVYGLMESADQFNIVGMFDDCCTFLMENMNYSNCISIRRATKNYYCDKLKKYTERFLTTNFQEISNENVLLDLSVEEITEIFQIDELNVKCEEMLWEVALAWINHDPTNRAKYIINIMTSVRLGLMNPEYFVEKVKSNPFVAENESCRPIIIEAMKCLFDLDIAENVSDTPWSQYQQARIPYEVVFAIGGWSGGSATSVMETYDPRTDMWIMVAPQDPHGPRAYHKCAVVGHKIYVIGGFDGIEYFNSCRCFNAVTAEWKEISPMYHRRCYVSVAALEDVIYAMGGNDGQKRLSSAERYICGSNQWQQIAPMTCQRSDACAAAFKGFVYIAGGFNGSDCLSTVEYYNPDANQWSLVSSMRTPRSGVSCIGYQDYLYVLGGFDGVSRLSSGEKYSPDTNTWSAITDMWTTRSNFAVMVIDDLIFAIGGFDGTETISSVECYDPRGDKWIKTDDMGLSRSALSACVVRDIPNVRDYIPARDSSLQLLKRRKLQSLQSSTSTIVMIQTNNF